MDTKFYRYPTNIMIQYIDVNGERSSVGRLAVGRLVSAYNIHKTNMKWNEKETAAKWTENENNNKIIYIVNYLKMVLRLNLKKKKEEEEEGEEIFIAKYFVAAGGKFFGALIFV